MRLGVSTVDTLDEASVVYSSYPSIIDSGWAPGFGRLLGEVWRDRGLGDFYGYMLVAEGAAEAMVEAELKIWDLAGPRAVIVAIGQRRALPDGPGTASGLQPGPIHGTGVDPENVVQEKRPFRPVALRVRDGAHQCIQRDCRLAGYQRPSSFCFWPLWL